jgi:hypothetical protein
MKMPIVCRRILISLAILFAYRGFTGCIVTEDVHPVLRLHDIPVPPGFTRAGESPDSFAAWLQELPLKKEPEIRLHTGELLTKHAYHIRAVLDKPLYFRENLEECVDFCLRLWADYHRETGQLDRLYLFAHDGRKVHFSKAIPDLLSAPAADAETVYLDFLQAGMAWSNPFSVTQGARPVSETEMEPGDLIIQTSGRSRGQASMILDACQNIDNQKRYLIGFGFSPAQEFHIERASDADGSGGWFSLEGYFRFIEANYVDFGKPALFRF